MAATTFNSSEQEVRLTLKMWVAQKIEVYRGCNPSCAAAILVEIGTFSRIWFLSGA